MLPTTLGWTLSTDNPLPANTNALRFSIGELVAGQQYFAEISLRVTGLPIDPVMNADVNCAEVFGGDAAMPQNGQDNSWRYYVPSPSCMNLDLFFDLEADRLYASQGDTITYTLRARNLSPNTQTNVVFTDIFAASDITFQAMLMGPEPTVSIGVLTWPTMSFEADQEYVFQWNMQVIKNNDSLLNRANYVSTELPAPGFSDRVLTNIQPLVLLSQDATVAPTGTSAGSDVRYTVTVANNGTSHAALDGESYIEVSLPAGFTYCGQPSCAEPTINAVVVADPASNGNILTFTNGLQAIPANGAALVLEFGVLVGGGAPAGQYTIDVRSRFDDQGFGKNVEVSSHGLAALLVDILRSDTPELDLVLAGATSVTGWTSEGVGATITVYIDGNPILVVLATNGGQFSAFTPTLYTGQRISATAQYPGKVVSNRISPETYVYKENLPPTLMVNTGLTVVEGGSSLITTTMLHTVDDISDPGQIFYRVYYPPASGKLLHSINTGAGAFTQAGIDNEHISYQHDGSEGVSDVFYFIVDDSANQLPITAFEITVLPVDDPPVVNSQAFVVKKGHKRVVTKEVLEAVDPDTPASEVVFEVVNDPLYGQLRRDDSVLGITDLFTQEDINLGRISYEHDGSETVVDGFSFQVSDGTTLVQSQVLVIPIFEYRIFADGFE